MLIEAFATIEATTHGSFDAKLKHEIESMQAAGLIVEIQYQIKGTAHTALILGRRP